MAGVEFLSPEPDEGAEEERVVDPRRPRRPRRGVVVAAVVAVLAAITAFVVAHAGGSSSPPAADTGRNSILPEQPSGADGPDHLGATTAPEGARGGRSVSVSASPVRTIECSSPSGCRIAASLPPQVIAAVRDRFPAAAAITGRTVLTDVDLPAATVVNRSVDATEGPLRLHIGLHPANDHDDPRHGSEAQDSRRVVYATALRGGLAVVVTVTGPPDRVPATSTVAALADDARLVAAV